MRGCSSAFRQALCLWGAALIPAVLSAFFFQVEWKRDASRVSLTEVESWKTPILWIDARSREKYDAGHWPGAIHLNADEWDALVGDFLAAWSPSVNVVVYCDSRACGASEEVAARIRKDFGHEAVFVLEGGWESLKEERK